ncbi:XRE family transcriptional regulator [Arthrobacter sp. TS-15]|uniref:helix-turn-helix domain-containing protein n=1 Tax=unclassified Arthrobacter TaxID=235627 RepID=UPI00115D8349|nr:MULTISPECIES: helix-turn-helix transcriptional regulator [unclassified Arthrobacter]TQS87749.1 XRE family transcriptional regulator [Arthrobacter sp. TS-15]
MTQISMGIGRRIGTFRRREGLSAQDLAEDSGMSRSVIANIETGRREDITVSELMALSKALRVPPVAILFDVTRPLAPVPASSDGEPEIMPMRTIDLVDWFAGIDGPAEWSYDRAAMEEELAVNGPAVMPVTGLVLEATYSDSGWDAIRLLTVGRQLRTARETHAELIRDFAFDVKTGSFGWEPDPDEHRHLMDAVSDLVDIEVAIPLEEFVNKVKEIAPGKASDAETAVRRLRSSAQDLRRFKGLLKSLGGDAGESPLKTDDEHSFPSFGREQILTLWTRMKFQFMRDLVDGDFNPKKHRTYDQIQRAIKTGKLRRKPEQSQ